MSIIPRPAAPVNRYRSLADFARNACDEYGDLFGPEEENPAGDYPMAMPTAADVVAMARHFGQEPTETDFHRFVARTVGSLQGLAMRLRTPGLADDAADRLEALAAELDTAQRTALARR